MWAKSKQDLKLPERRSSLSTATVLGEDAPAKEKLASGGCGGHSHWCPLVEIRDAASRWELPRQISALRWGSSAASRDAFLMPSKDCGL